MGPLAIYISMLVIAVLIYVTVMVFHRPVSRPCHRCGARVTLGNRRCKYCDYLFED